MGFLSRGGDGDPEQDESLARVQGGGIPLRAEQRLRALGTDGSLFTSGLSVNEFALLSRLGPRPLAQVMGASVVRTGWQYLPPLEPGIVNAGGWYSGRAAAYVPTATGVQLQNLYTEPSLSQVRSYQWRTEVVCELDVLTDAWNLARRRALDRLREEALQVGADAVVGVHLHRSGHDLGRGTIEYMVTGTAVRLPEAAGASSPTLTDVSAQEYCLLHGAGQDPVGLLAATTVVFASAPRATRLRRARTPRRNQELEELSRGFHAARETLRTRLLGQVADEHGTGAVGVEFSHAVHREKFALGSSLQTTDRRGWHLGRFGVPYRVSGHSDTERRGWVITMHLAGTAIRRRDGAPLTIKTAIRMG
jgi:uncharacterized protein YbjQ (UPF0145 family)